LQKTEKPALGCCQERTHRALATTSASSQRYECYYVATKRHSAALSDAGLGSSARPCCSRGGHMPGGYGRADRNQRHRPDHHASAASSAGLARHELYAMTRESGIWRLRRLIPCSEVQNLADQKDAVAAGERVEAELDRKLGAVLAFTEHFASLSRAARGRSRPAFLTAILRRAIDVQTFLETVTGFRHLVGGWERRGAGCIDLYGFT